MVSLYQFHQSLLPHRSESDPLCCLNSRADVISGLWIVQKKMFCTWSVPPCAVDLLFNMKQLLLLSVSPASFCRVISEPANYCWAELVTSFSLWICDGCWKCKNLPGEEERKESVAGLMKHTCWVAGLNQHSVLILPTAFLLTYHNMQLLHIPLGHGAAPCRWTIIQSFSSQPNSTHISSINCFKWLTHMNYVQMYLFCLGAKSNNKCLPAFLDTDLFTFALKMPFVIPAFLNLCWMEVHRKGISPLKIAVRWSVEIHSQPQR